MGDRAAPSDALPPTVNLFSGPGFGKRGSQVSRQTTGQIACFLRMYSVFSVPTLIRPTGSPPISVTPPSPSTQALPGTSPPVVPNLPTHHPKGGQGRKRWQNPYIPAHSNKPTQRRDSPLHYDRSVLAKSRIRSEMCDFCIYPGLGKPPKVTIDGRKSPLSRIYTLSAVLPKIP